MPTAQDSTQKLFHTEYERELEHWLHRRFRSVCVGYLIGAVLILLYRSAFEPFEAGEGQISAYVFHLGGNLLYLVSIIYFLIYSRGLVGVSREQILRSASILIIILGTISLGKSVLIGVVAHRGYNILLSLFFWHFLACLFLPWTPRESLKPMVPLMVAWMATVIFLPTEVPWATRMVTMIFAPGILIPGLGICAFRLKQHSEQFRARMVGKHFMSMRQELVKARSIHESMFPQPYNDGFVRFDYTYAPMRELGGDFIHLHVSPQGLVHLSILDVTGHGLSAALTVNRMHGEMDRIRGESPHAEPGEVLTLLNRYIHLTMVRHNIYATALCVTIDPYEGKVMWASAGHPPGFLRGANGTVTKLDSTTMLLGALNGEEFSSEQQSVELSPGDVVVVYTDGTFEARDRLGEQLGLERLSNLMRVQPAPKNWPQFLTAAVQKHSAAHAEDDSLIASLTFHAQRKSRAQRAQATVSAS